VGQVVEPTRELLAREGVPDPGRLYQMLRPNGSEIASGSLENEPLRLMGPEPGSHSLAQRREAERLAGRRRDRAEHDHLRLDRHHERHDSVGQVVEPTRELLAREGVPDAGRLYEMLRPNGSEIASGSLENETLLRCDLAQPISPGVSTDIGLEAAVKATGAGQTRKLDGSMPDLARPAEGAPI
jgi:hypothetical protein